MREVLAEANVVETMRKVIVECIRDNECENTQIWLNDEVVKKLQDAQIYGTINYPYEGYTMSAFELRTGDIGFLAMFCSRKNGNNIQQGKKYCSKKLA